MTVPLPPVALQVGTVSPSADTTYPGSDWLIGNHSDELTPWIPVMAAATGPDTCFFLLPCCPWDFYSKYQRADTRSVSQCGGVPCGVCTGGLQLSDDGIDHPVSFLAVKTDFPLCFVHFFGR